MSARIAVLPVPCFLPEQSSPERRNFVFSYTITLENHGDAPAQLLSRHWVITDETGAVQEVRGLGVVGEQPVLAPGGRYAYTSGCTLPTSLGTMKGSYQFAAADGNRFDVDIPEFVLAVPGRLH